MTIDRYMVNLFFEIKRNLPLKYRQNLKIADSELADSLIDIYYEHKDDSTQRLIEVFFNRAGKPWEKQLLKRKTSKFSITKTENLPLESTKKSTQSAVSTVKNTQTANATSHPRYYRGVLIK